MKRLICGLVLSLSLACAHAYRNDPEVLIAHSSGGPGPSITFLSIYHDGVIELMAGGRSWRVSAPERATELRGLLESELIRAELRQVRARGYRSGCCDAEDITLQVGGEVFELAVNAFEESGPAVRIVYEVPPALGAALDRAQAAALELFPKAVFFPLNPSPNGG